MSDQWFDLSHPISEATPPFPGDPAVEISVLDVTSDTTDSPRTNVNSSRLSACLHCGTHMDAPYHFFGNGKTIDQIPIQWTCGPAVLIDLRGDLNSEPNAVIERSTLERHDNLIAGAARLVIYSGWQANWMKDNYFDEHPVFTRESARYLVQSGVKLLGVDFPSVDHRPNEAHLELLGNDVLILENLTGLDALQETHFELVATPLAIQGRDGSPVRAVARVKGEA